MASVGYGDIVPVTHFGRIFSVFAMLAGQFMNSLLLYAMSISSSLSLAEQKVFKMVKTVEHFENLSHQAASIITTVALIKLLTKGYKVNRFEKIGPIKAMNRLEIEVKIKIRKFKSFQK